MSRGWSGSDLIEEERQIDAVIDRFDCTFVYCLFNLKIDGLMGGLLYDW